MSRYKQLIYDRIKPLVKKKWLQNLLGFAEELSAIIERDPNPIFNDSIPIKTTSNKDGNFTSFTFLYDNDIEKTFIVNEVKISKSLK